LQTLITAQAVFSEVFGLLRATRDGVLNTIFMLVMEPSSETLTSVSLWSAITMLIWKWGQAILWKLLRVWDMGHLRQLTTTISLTKKRLVLATMTTIISPWHWISKNSGSNMVNTKTIYLIWI